MQKRETEMQSMLENKNPLSHNKMARCECKNIKIVKIV